MTTSATPKAPVPGAGERIVKAVTEWPEVTAVAGRRGELSIRFRKQEIGHLHGDHAAHFGFPRRQWQELIDEGRVARHPIDHPGWAARRISSEADIDEVIALLRLNYERSAGRGK